MPGEVDDLARMVRGVDDLPLNCFEDGVLFAADDDCLVEIRCGQRAE